MNIYLLVQKFGLYFPIKYVRSMLTTSPFKFSSNILNYQTKERITYNWTASVLVFGNKLIFLYWNHTNSSGIPWLANESTYLTPWNSPLWETKSYSAIQTHRLLWNRTVYYHIHKRCHCSLSWGRWIHSTSSHPIEGQFSYYFNIHAKTSKVLSSLQIFWLKFCMNFPSLVRVTRFAHFILLDMVTIITQGVE
jgi:hypothetical protein